MSQPQTSIAAQGQPIPAAVKTSINDCALLLDEFGPVIASSKTLGLPTKLGAKVCLCAQADADPWLGFSLELPLGKDQVGNEASGFGVLHQVRRCHDDEVVPVDHRRLDVKFPRGKIQTSFEDASGPVLARFPNAKRRDKGMTVFKVVMDDALATIHGFGYPFANADDAEVEGWVNDNKPIVDGITMMDVLRSKRFCFILPVPFASATKFLATDRLPAPFMYPYGPLQEWDISAYKGAIAKHKGHQFMPAFSHPSDLSHITSVVQAAVQDVMWIDDAVQEILELKFPAYFVSSETRAAEDIDRFHAVVALTTQFREEYDSPWRRLTKGETFKIRLFNSFEDKEADETWDCKIIEYPSKVDALNDHPVDKHEIVLYVRRPKPKLEASKEKKKKQPYKVKTFPDRTNCLTLEFDAKLQDCKRKVDATVVFTSEALPSNIVGCGLPQDPETGELADNLSEEEFELLEKVQDRMNLHRALLRGTGFWDWMVIRSLQDLAGPLQAMNLDDAPPAPAPKLRALPSTNFLDFEDEAYADAIVTEALPQDRSRFRGYLSNRPFGLGMITAGPGFGKTTAGAAATIAMHAKLGKILCSAPTNVAIDNFASRLERRGRAVVERYNNGLQEGQARRRRPFVVRAFKPHQEEEAFLELLRKPQAVNKGASKPTWGVPSKWTLPMSCTFWLLVILRSPLVRELHPDDCEALHEIQESIDSREKFDPVRKLAKGDITWEQFRDMPDVEDSLDAVCTWLPTIARRADMLCTTPAATNNVKAYQQWKQDIACGIAVDEAANMHRSDLYCVWGNTLLPCFLFGDRKQLPPAIMTGNEKERVLPSGDPDDKGEGKDEVKDNEVAASYINRFAKDGKVSALQYMQASGLPVYRLKTQLRMAKGMFDMVAGIIYPDVPFEYAASRSIDHAEFQIGRDLEAFAQAKFPGLKKCLEGTLKPFFIHCEGSYVFTDPSTGSKRSPDQVTVALDFTAEFIKTKKADPARIIFISPYPANVRVINGMRRKPEYACLTSMPDAMTVDSFQGQENDLAIVVMGTAHPNPGPGFTSNSQRLNVMLTRQKCGLVIVGDIYVAGAVTRGKKKGPAQTKFIVEGPNGEISMVKAAALRQLYKELHGSGRVATVVVREAKKTKEGKEDKTSSS
ncbi:hypothetical protein N0V84_001444 [Fusarium piperis]|uniref:DNA2/NAM7 helicase-like C-terminal domain-containing protein n=1 Tax=Fusarium piperis TaxID=1435070 RepID=A0A9W8WL08_9HYPO|nr:hypothetical protein N0V84_001444 [Fusarium piperis]